MDSHAFLQNLAVVLCVAAVATVVFQKLRQPVVFGYLLAGMIIGPHISIPLVADPQTVRALSELGVILLMFSLGLEFSIRKLVLVSQKAGAVALFECSVMICDFAWLELRPNFRSGKQPLRTRFARRANVRADWCGRGRAVRAPTKRA
jgi:Kef-type K+ transport system membrane component KefB